MAELAGAQDRCPRCAARFGCGVATGACWCAELALPPERLRELVAGYEGCLCPACLAEAARPISGSRIP